MQIVSCIITLTYYNFFDIIKAINNPITHTQKWYKWNDIYVLSKYKK